MRRVEKLTLIFSYIVCYKEIMGQLIVSNSEDQGILLREKMVNAPFSGE